MLDQSINTAGPDKNTSLDSQLVLLYSLRKSLLYSPRRLLGLQLLVKLLAHNKINFPPAFLFDSPKNFADLFSVLFSLIFIAKKLEDPFWSPSCYFDSKNYLKNYPDIADTKQNAWFHYQTFGWREFRTPSSKLNPLALEAELEITDNPQVFAVDYYFHSKEHVD